MIAATHTEALQAGGGTSSRSALAGGFSWAFGTAVILVIVAAPVVGFAVRR